MSGVVGVIVEVSRAGPQTCMLLVGNFTHVNGFL